MEEDRGMKNVGLRIAGSLLLLWAAIIAGLLLPFQSVAGYASSYIGEEEFLEGLLTACGVECAESETVFEAAARAGIAEEKKKGASCIKRSDAAVMLARAFEMMDGKKDNKLQEICKEKRRITDLDQIEEDKKEFVLTVYAAGIVPGYKKSNYDEGREFRGNKKLTAAAAQQYIVRLEDPKKRFSLTPDGQVIRLGTLPKYASKYPYILENFPDSYYDWSLRFETVRQFQTGEMEEDVYAFPAGIEKVHWFDGRLSKPLAEYAEIWAEMVRAYAELAFRVDYRTIERDDPWFQAMYALDADSGASGNQEALKERLGGYIDSMKENRTIVELKTAAADPSSLYYFNGSFYIRLYVKYRVMSSKILNPTEEEILYDRSFNSVIYSDEIEVLSNLKLGEWREGYYDIALSTPNAGTDGSDIKISGRAIQDEYFLRTVVR